MLLLIVFAVDVLLLVFASILLAILLRTLAEPLAARLHISPRWALAIVVAMLVVSLSVIGALLFGWRGLLLAAPATAALLVTAQMVYVEDTLGERDAR